MRFEVPGDMRWNCERAVMDAAHLLGIKTPVIRWKTGAGQLAGWVNYHADNEIHLNIDVLRALSPDELRALVYHECRHCWQWQTYRYIDRYKDELDAESFSYRHTGVLLPGPYYTR